MSWASWSRVRQDGQNSARKKLQRKKFERREAPVWSQSWVRDSHTHTIPIPIIYNTAAMAKTENDIREKKEKKDKKRKADDDVEDVSAKKDKKKKRKSVDAEMEDAPVVAAEVVVKDADSDDENPSVLLGALVPFANPLADEKQQKKVLKTVKKCMRQIPRHCKRDITDH